MNFAERILVRKEVDATMNAIKKYWPTAVHVIVLAAGFADPSVRVFLQHNPQYAGLGLVVWAELMHWLQSPRSNPALQK